MNWDVDAFNDKSKSLLEITGSEVAVFRTPQQTQAAIKFASERGVDVSGLRVVGTDLSSVTYIESRVTAAKHLLSGVMTGMWFAVIFTFGYSVMWSELNPLILGLIILASVLGGVTFNSITLATGSARNRFITQKGLVAARYAILAETHIPQYTQFFASVPGNLLRPETVVAPDQPEVTSQPNMTDLPLTSGSVPCSQKPSEYGSRPDEQPRYGVRLPVSEEQDSADSAN
ncbi:hypothetical protein HMPREF0044_0762 [Gleimia coleocanis DSM 15436]|uniref:General stress protein 17M-like domain-containing protein n=1 Tax=Gleimia coleocanis DSM 15436 TaxID=525245 RepID=C0W119_9ACTO|nr:general stress protein [Gleimia coleocanis]EEH63743.1 hypothetical protein HMPREF0044_0762 [Gleimia coleocanis DSM 15436]